MCPRPACSRNSFSWCSCRCSSSTLVGRPHGVICLERVEPRASVGWPGGDHDSGSRVRPPFRGAGNSMEYLSDARGNRVANRPDRSQRDREQAASSSPSGHPARERKPRQRRHRSRCLPVRCGGGAWRRFLAQSCSVCDGGGVARRSPVRTRGGARRERGHGTHRRRPCRDRPSAGHGLRRLSAGREARIVRCSPPRLPACGSAGAARRTSGASRSRLQAGAFWETLIFWSTGVLFLMLGLQMHTLLLDRGLASHRASGGLRGQVDWRNGRPALSLDLSLLDQGAWAGSRHPLLNRSWAK